MGYEMKEIVNGSGRRKAGRAAAVLAAFALLAGLSSCSALFGPKLANKAGTTTLAVSVNGLSRSASRTILPANTALTGLLYDVSITQSGSPINATGLAYNAITLTGVEAGTWTLTVTGKQGTNAEFEGSTGVTITAGAANAANVTLEPLQAASGSLNVTVNWPTTQASVNGASAYWTQDLSQIKGVPSAWIAPMLATGVTSNFGSETLNIQVPSATSGTWYLAVNLTSSGVTVATVEELVQVYDYQTSTATINLAATDFSQPPAAPSNCYYVVNQTTGVPSFIWTDNSNTESGFYIYYGGSRIWTVGPGATSFTAPDNRNFTPGTTTCSVTAFNNFGESTPIQSVLADMATVPFLETEVGFTFTGIENPWSINLGNGVSISPAPIVGASVTNTPTIDAGSWKWYVNGVDQGSGVDGSSTFNFLPAAAGEYLVTVTATMNGVLYSGQLKVVVTSPSGSYTVTYSNRYADSGSPPVDPKTYNGGDSATVLGSGTLSRSNCTFGGWTDGTTSYVSTSSLTVNGNVTLYPVWTPTTSGYAMVVGPTGSWTGLAMSGDGKTVAAENWGSGGLDSALYLSTDFGTSWNNVQATNDGAISTVGLSMSADGNHVAMANASGSVFLGSNSGGAWSWTTLVGHPWNGSVAIDDSGQYLLAGDTSATGLEYSSNGGSSWSQPSSEPWTSIGTSIGLFAVNATGNGDVAYDTLGNLYVSTDSGAAWTSGAQPSGGYSFSGIAMARDDATPTHIAVFNGDLILFTTVNGGTTWTEASLPVNGTITSVAWSADGSVVLAAIAGGGIVETKDPGETTPVWTLIPGLPTSDSWSSIAVNSNGTLAFVAAQGGNIWEVKP